jgi:tRNA(Ile)-lysidine synthase
MARLGPFGDCPHIAVGVSGGADSTALALLMQGWVAAQQGRLVALIVDHGLRAGAGAEAALTQDRLAVLGIAAKILTIPGLGRGAALQARARAARHTVLAEAARAAGCAFLALGHHAGDQSETVAMRAARGAHGLEGMAGWAARRDVLLLRPLLAVEPARLRDYLRAEHVEWVEDPSNGNEKFERVRLRQAGVADVAADAGARRAIEAEAADFLARYVTLRPEGFFVVAADAMPPVALGALLRVAAGADYPPGRAKLADLAANMRPATLGGARIAKTAKFGGGWLVAREPAACAEAVPAVAGVVWDGRFRLAETVPGAMLGALGDEFAALARPDIPAMVRRGMPCLRLNGRVQPELATCRFTPPFPATTHPFVA